MRLLIPAALLAIAFAPLGAQTPPQPPGTLDPKAAVAGQYTVEPKHTQVRFGVMHMGIAPFYGTFSQVTGTLNLDRARPEATSVSIEVPMASVVTPSAKLNEELVSPMFFDAAQYPTMKFVSDSVRIHGTHATIAGQLTLHGVTRPLVLEASFTGAGVVNNKTTVGFTATGTLRRSDYRVTTEVPLVSDAVQIDISVAFERPA